MSISNMKRENSQRLKQRSHFSLSSLHTLTALVAFFAASLIITTKAPSLHADEITCQPCFDIIVDSNQDGTFTAHDITFKKPTCDTFTFDIVGESGPRNDDLIFTRDANGRIIKVCGTVTFQNKNNPVNQYGRSNNNNQNQNNSYGGGYGNDIGNDNNNNNLNLNVNLNDNNNQNNNHGGGYGNDNKNDNNNNNLNLNANLNDNKNNNQNLNANVNDNQNNNQNQNNNLNDNNNNNENNNGNASSGNKFCVQIDVVWSHYCIGSIDGIVKLIQRGTTTTTLPSTTIPYPTTTNPGSTTRPAVTTTVYTTTSTSTTITTTTTSTTTTTCAFVVLCRDADNDGFGNPNVSIKDCVNNQTAGFVRDCSDCDDADASANPKAYEACSDSIDNDCDGHIDCADDDCSCDQVCQTNSECNITSFSEDNGKGSKIKFNFKKEFKDRATIRMCVDKCFAASLKKGGLVGLVIELGDCDPITIDSSSLKHNKSNTVFRAKASTHRLKIDLKKGWLLLTLKNVDLKRCIYNPVKICVTTENGTCICAEAVFEEKTRKGRVRNLSIEVEDSCPTHH